MIRTLAFVGFFLLLTMLGLLGRALGSGFTEPIGLAWMRPKILNFGMYISPDSPSNPIHPPERFVGYHTAQDYEILPWEKDSDVAVYAACTGKATTAGFAEGYGGVVVQHCMMNGKDVSVLYGHLLRSSFTVKTGDTVTRGAKIAILAPAHSEDSGENRKHLHFGIHVGTTGVFLGYVQQESDLKDFIDPETTF